MLVAPRVAAELAQAALEALASHSPIALAQRLDAARRGADSNAMDLDDSGGSDPDPGRAVTPAETRAAAMVAMCRAAARAKLMADQQEREMELLAVRVLEIQQERVDIKLKHLEQLEKVGAVTYTSAALGPGCVLTFALKLASLFFPSRRCWR